MVRALALYSFFNALASCVKILGRGKSFNLGLCEVISLMLKKKACLELYRQSISIFDRHADEFCIYKNQIPVMFVIYSFPDSLLWLDLVKFKFGKE
jgi:hypothetical protein